MTEMSNLVWTSFRGIEKNVIYHLVFQSTTLHKDAIPFPLYWNNPTEQNIY